MREYLVKVTRKGQITVPAEIRKALDLHIGDKVAVSLVEENGSLCARLRRVGSVTDMTFGAVHADWPPMDEKVIHNAWAEAAIERDERSKRS